MPDTYRLIFQPGGEPRETVPEFSDPLDAMEWVVAYFAKARGFGGPIRIDCRRVGELAHERQWSIVID